MLNDSLQIFEVNSRMQFEGNEITIDGYNKHKSIYFGLIVLDLEGKACDSDEFVILGSLPNDIIHVTSIVVDRSDGKLRITLIGKSYEHSTTIVPKGDKMLDVELFFRTPTYITNNNIKIKGGYSSAD